MQLLLDSGFFCFVTKVTLTEVLPCSVSSREHRQGSLWHNPYSGSATEVAGITMLYCEHIIPEFPIGHLTQN